MRSPRARALLAALAVAGSAMIPARASAQSREAAAARLFEEARALQARGSENEACARFEASEKLDPAVGTLLNIAECAERKGSTATAWVRYRQAAAMAARRADAEREAVATRKIDDVEKRLSRLVLRASAPLPPSASIVRDEEIVPVSELGVAVPVDPGDHRVTVRAPGYRSWTATARVLPGPTVVSLALPALERAAPTNEEATTPAVAATAPTPARPSAEPATASKRSASTSAWTWVIGGAGVAALAGGAFFALRARSIWSDIETRCPSGRCPDQSTVEALGPGRNDAQRDASASTVLLLGGAIAVAAAVILELSQPTTPPVSSLSARGAR